ncbi:MAG TPA: DUF4301 family protein [Flavobacterium sp.]|nr:DUF4301 family protein [Flavobacterium sp.]
MEENLKQLTLEGRNITKIAVVGAPGTDISALVRQLTAHYNAVNTTAPVLELAGDSEQDFFSIAYAQTQHENEQTQLAQQYIFCDSCVLVTKVASDLRLGTSDPRLQKAARKHKYDLFFLVTGKSSDGAQQKFETAITQELDLHNKPYLTLKAAEDEYFNEVTELIQQFELAKNLGFSSADFIQMHQHGISTENISDHLKIFKKGIPKITLDRPATKGDGIIKMTADEYQELATYFDGQKNQFTLEKFVPSSGAASRMFKFLTTFINDFDDEEESINAYINRKQATDLNIFLAGMEKFPFFEAVDRKMRTEYEDFASWPRGRKNYQFIKTMLLDPQFDFCNKPKAVLPFHKYATHIATPIEEHLHEAVNYAASNNSARLHFTVSDSHQTLFEEIISANKDAIAGPAGVRVNIGFSYQDKITDTVAVDLQGKPFRTDSGKLVFRPAGHGALLANLNKLDSDIIFIKNIDNVIQDHITTISLYKKALGGLLIQLRQQVFEYLMRIDAGNFTEDDLEQATEFVQSKLNIKLNVGFDKYTSSHKISHLQNLLNRPIRVCGMVKNEGEPGGGPFWVRDNNGNESLQIVETSQVDMQNANQLKVVQSAAYFNPVDIVCGIKDFRGSKFNLHDFTDPESGFIVSKTKNGRDLRAYEMPGLWNGAMANWITVFAEVPLITFNPVKTVNDLLKPAHQQH